MGHERIGFIPKTKQWQLIVAQLQNYNHDKTAVAKEDRIVGLICAGVESVEESSTNSKQGFIPINTIIQDIVKKGC